jgi:subtilisin family serine protease
MRYLGKEYDGEGVTIAVIDSGVNADDPRLKGARIEGWAIELGATGHALIRPNYEDEHGHGTEIAAAVHRMAPKAKIVAVKIMGERLRTSAELMAAGIETAALNGSHVINLSLGTPNMGKALRLRDCCGQAVERGSVVLAAAHPRGERVYPADLPETIGVSSHPDCPIDKMFYFEPKRFPRKTWPSLTDKFLTHGHSMANDRGRTRYRGSGLATSYLSGQVACLRQALPDATASEIIDRLRRRALMPMPEIGYT